MTAEVKTTPPEMTVGDLAHLAARTIISGIPGAGGPLKEFFSALVTPPLTKRRDEWVQSIAEGLVALQQKIHGFTFEALQNNETFVTTVMHATQIAMCNHQKEKLEALRNAVLNVAVGTGPDDDLQLMFLNFVDSLTPWHIRLLRFFQDPVAYAKARGISYPDRNHPHEYIHFGSFMDALRKVLPGQPAEKIDETQAWELILDQVFPQITGSPHLRNQIVTDLSTRGLIYPLYEVEEHNLLEKRTSLIGDLFIKFVSYPPH